jgi:hypothetical protein
MDISRFARYCRPFRRGTISGAIMSLPKLRIADQDFGKRVPDADPPRFTDPILR